MNTIDHRHVPGATSVLERMRRSVGQRHGLIRSAVPIPAAAADLATVHHASVGFDDDPTRSAGGGVGRSSEVAEIAALGETLERYVARRWEPDLVASELIDGGAARIGLDEFTLHSRDQRARPDFPHHRAYPDSAWMTEVFDLSDNTPVFVPAALVGLTDEFGALATSSGLALDSSVWKALLRACQELVERDAYMATWMHQLSPPRVRAEALEREVAELGGSVEVYDISPAYSSQRVALVAGDLPLRGMPRPSIGLACRTSWEAAVEKAFLEFAQGVLFVGHQLTGRPEFAGLTPEQTVGFDEHAVFYGANPSWWEEVPVRRGRDRLEDPPLEAAPSDADRVAPVAQLEQLVSELGSAGVRLLYRELTTPDVAQLGFRVVRVLSPELTPLHHDHNWPFLGGSAPDVALRYPGRSSLGFPSPYPHALG